MSLASEYGMPSDFEEEKLLFQAEDAARKCSICQGYGHGWEECQQSYTLSRKLTMVEAEPPKLENWRSATGNWWLYFVLLVSGFVLSCLLVGVMRP